MPATSKGLFIAAFLAALSPFAAAAQSDAGKTLRVVPHADLTVVNPQFIGVYITCNFGYLVYDTLFGMDRDFRPRPEMVESLKRDKERGPKIAIEGRSEERLAEPPGEVLDELPRDAAGP